MLFIMPIKRLFKKIYRRLVKEPSVVRLRPQGSIKGQVLLSYLITPFIYKENKAMLGNHSNHWECTQIAEIFLSCGYAVDVIDYKNRKFVPKRKYDFLVSLPHSMSYLVPLLNKDCRIFLHLTGTQWEVRNKAAAIRLDSLQKRKLLKE